MKVEVQKVEVQNTLTSLKPSILMYTRSPRILNLSKSSMKTQKKVCAQTESPKRLQGFIWNESPDELWDFAPPPSPNKTLASNAVCKGCSGMGPLSLRERFSSKGCPLFRGCPLLGGNIIKGCPLFRGCPLLGGNIVKGCPLFRGCPLLGGNIIKGCPLFRCCPLFKGSRLITFERRQPLADYSCVAVACVVVACVCMCVCIPPQVSITCHTQAPPHMALAVLMTGFGTAALHRPQTTH